MASDRVRKFFEEHNSDIGGRVPFLEAVEDARMDAAIAFLAAMVRSGSAQGDEKYAIARAVSLADGLLEELAKDGG